MANHKLITVPVADLHFDRKNPRLAEFGLSSSVPEKEIVALLWDVMDIKELVQSIATVGFFKHETLIIAEEDGKKVVIEGNRRLAAVRYLLDSSIVDGDDYKAPKITAKARNELKKLPVVISNREEAWQYLGFKHVNGPARWSSYAKAKYIADVHRNYGVSLANISDQIGDRHRTVQRLYRGLMVIEQAEAKKVFDREDRFKTRLAFSHLYTGLDYEGIQSFLDLRPEGDEATDPVPNKKVKQLGDLLLWLYGSKGQKIPPVIQSQNPHLRQLDVVLKSREGIAALRSEGNLASAFEISRPPTAVFEEALLNAKRQLQRARAYLTTGYDDSEDLLRIAGTVANLADDIYREMERKKNPEKKKRLSEKK